MYKKKLSASLALVMGMTMVTSISSKATVYNGQEKSGSDWYYYSNGSMRTGWVSDGSWYYLKDNGAMATGWQKINGTWYYLNSDGAMKTGWLNYGGTWYSLNESGAMVTNPTWVETKLDRGAYTSLTTDKIKYTITNYTDSDISFGKEYKIQKIVNNEWKDVLLKNDTFIEIAQILQPKQSLEELIPVENIDENTPMGEYRIVKNINGKEYINEFSLYPAGVQNSFYIISY